MNDVKVVDFFFVESDRSFFEMAERADGRREGGEVVIIENETKVIFYVFGALAS